MLSKQEKVDLVLEMIGYHTIHDYVRAMHSMNGYKVIAWTDGTITGVSCAQHELNSTPLREHGIVILKSGGLCGPCDCEYCQAGEEAEDEVNDEMDNIEHQLKQDIDHILDVLGLHICEHETCEYVGSELVACRWIDADGKESEKVFMVCDTCLGAGSPTGPGYRPVED